MAVWQFHSLLSFAVLISGCGSLFSSRQPGAFLAVSIAVAVAMWALVGWLFRHQPAIAVRTLIIVVLLLFIVLVAGVLLMPLVAWLTDAGYNGGASPLRPYISLMPYIPMLVPMAAAIVVLVGMKLARSMRFPAVVFAGVAALVSLAVVLPYAALAVSACAEHL